MNRATRNKFVAGTDQKQLTYGRSACLETPREIFAALHKEFAFDVDLTANEKNHLLPRWFGPGNKWKRLCDTLTVDWASYGQNGYSNPPYGRFVRSMFEKAREQQLCGFRTVLLIPLRVTRAFKDLVVPFARVRYVDERIVFTYRGKQTQFKDKTGKWRKAGALFDSVIVVFDPDDVVRARLHPHGEGCLRCPTVWTWKEPKQHG